jgi:hypothetical protein
LSWSIVMSTKCEPDAEFLEGREEFVVAGRHGWRWQEGAHRERIDQLVVELLVAHGI